MKKLAGLFTAAAMLMHCIPASAETAVITPHYPLEHPGDATLYVNAAEDLEYGIEIYQSSPERSKLCLYSITMPLKKGDSAAFPLETGDYTVCVTVGATKDHLAPQTMERSFNVLNLDFTNAYKENHINFNLALNHDDTAENTSVVERDSKVEDGIYAVDYDFTFTQYDRLRGDFTGDGEIKMNDAFQVLMIFTMELTHLTPDVPPTAGQIAACDLNMDGTLDIHDAKDILDYVVGTSIGLTMEWRS